MLTKGKARDRGSRSFETGDWSDSRQMAAPCTHEVQGGVCSVVHGMGRAGLACLPPLKPTSLGTQAVSQVSRHSRLVGVTEDTHCPLPS